MMQGRNTFPSTQSRALVRLSTYHSLHLGPNIAMVLSRDKFVRVSIHTVPSEAHCQRPTTILGGHPYARGSRVEVRISYPVVVFPASSNASLLHVLCHFAESIGCLLFRPPRPFVGPVRASPTIFLLQIIFSWGFSFICLHQKSDERQWGDKRQHKGYTNKECMDLSRREIVFRHFSCDEEKNGERYSDKRTAKY